MRFNEFATSAVQAFTGRVRVVANGMGTVVCRIKIEADNLMAARYALSRIYGRENVLAVQQTVIEDGGLIQSLTPEQLQIKTLNDKSSQLKQQAKRTKAQQNVQKAQAKLAKVNSSSVSSHL